ncbi:MAG: N-acetylglucosamine transport system substrate-binding protein [Streptosporangiaceae bacterium]|jgi:N-acetylglucosamine transport system substrate-binding protein|nr:ABC-type sugar transport system periplasmic component-like protein [Streptosporangiaceae bacterium]MDX6429965.1 N-acetylglucosamine transport system substrate-binding protein [Streptosporangiaceae bacterium]
MSEISVPAKGIDRRQMLQRIGLTALIAGPGISMLSACATSGSGNSTPKQTVKANGGSVNPFGVKADAPIDIVIFKGGLGDDYATQVHEPAYVKKFPQAKLKHEGIVEINKTLQPRFSGGSNIPDVVANSGADIMDSASLAQGGQLQDLTQLWDAPSIDDPSKKVRDTVIAGAPEAGYISGKPYLMKYVSSSYGLWYNAKLFAKNGWTAPKTFDELKALCDKIKAAGITPFAYAGKNAAYYQYASILISAAQLGGKQVLIDIDNLAAGAWNNPAVKQAAAAWAEIGAKYSDKSFKGLIHTEVQTMQNKDKVAFYPSGSWLENEQKKSTPASFEYALAPNPSITAADKMPYGSIRVAAGEGYFVSAKAANVAGGLEYFRIMLSKEGAKGFYQKSGSMTVVKNSLEGVDLSPGAKSTVAAQKVAGDNIVADSFFPDWYKALADACFKETNTLMFDGGSADQFCANMQKAADKIKADSSITKQTRTA